jgi:hypothetical protein
VPREIDLVLRVAHALFADAPSNAGEVACMLEWAAQTGDRDAQYAFGLWLAHMNAGGKRISAIPGTANYKRAMRWLSQAAGQGLPAAWYALSKIYLKPECSWRSSEDAKRCLEYAAQGGHGQAQPELGLAAWRARREHESNDVRAVFWLQKAMAQGIDEAAKVLDRIVVHAKPATWAKALLERLPHTMMDAHPQLVARLELAARFGLSRTEALLINPGKADRGYCLVVDIRARHPHSKRRLIRVQTAEERRALDRFTALFEQVDGEPEGPEREISFDFDFAFEHTHGRPGQHDR